MKVQGVELSELDLNNTGSWPPVIKFLAALLVCAAVVGAGWYFSWQDQQERLARVEAQEPQLRSEFETKQGRAANLGAYEELLEEMERSLEARLRELPSRVEVPPLLVDISQAGLGAGLEFELFRPGSSVRRDFYAEMPIQIRVRGRFHEFGRFVSDVANLPRIVTLHDVEISRGGGDNGELTMSATARTYWYLDDEGEDES